MRVPYRSTDKLSALVRVMQLETIPDYWHDHESATFAEVRLRMSRDPDDYTTFVMCCHGLPITPDEDYVFRRIRAYGVAPDDPANPYRQEGAIIIEGIFFEDPKVPDGEFALTIYEPRLGEDFSQRKGYPFEPRPRPAH